MAAARYKLLNNFIKLRAEVYSPDPTGFNLIDTR